MKRVVSILLGTFLCDLLFSVLVLAYPWPMKNDAGNFNGPLPVSATLGDARGTNSVPRFHRGIDIAKTGGVYSLESGQMPWYDETSPPSFVRIGNYYYDHIGSLVPSESDVIGILESTAPTIIGGVAGNHLHFQIGPANGPFTNPLSDGGPNNYTDTGIPIVWAPNFWKSGSETQNPQQILSPIYGKIDIRAKCQDLQTSATSGIYRIEWGAKDSQGNWAVPLAQTTVFPQVQPPNNGNPVRLVYDRWHYSARSPFYYWVTNPIINHQVKDRWWNTNLRKGQQWNGENARVPDPSNTYGPQYPDGKYVVWVKAFDIIGNGGNMGTRKGAEDEEVIVDNFRPFLKRAKITREAETKYQREWTFDGTNLNSAEPSVEIPLGSGEYPITILFGEPVTNATLSIDTFGSIPLTSSDPENNKKTWTGTLSVPSDDSSHDGERTMTINAFDLAGNQTLQIGAGTTQINPATQLTRNSAGTMQGVGGQDTLHKFTIDSRPFVREVRITKGATDKYKREWTFDGTYFNSAEPSIDKPISIGNYTITIMFSEPVRGPILFVATLDELINLTSSELENEQKTWTGTLIISEDDSSHDGVWTMVIDAYDLTDNQILQIGAGMTWIDPATQLSITGETGGYDTLHKFIVDTTPPEFGDFYPVHGSFIVEMRPQISVTISDDEGGGVDADTIKMFLDGQEVSCYFETMASVTIYHDPQEDLSEGEHIVRVVASDLAGNEDEASVNFVIDVTAPTAHLFDSDYNEIPEYSFTNSAFISVEANDPTPGAGIGRIELTGTEPAIFDEGPDSVSYTFSSLSDGEYTVEVRDRVNNTFYSHFAIDTIEPSVNVVYPPDGAGYSVSDDLTNPPDHISVMASDEFSGLARVEVALYGAGSWWNGEDWQSQEVYRTAPYEAPGTHTWAEGKHNYYISVRAIDMAGNIGEAESVFTVDRDSGKGFGAYIDTLVGNTTVMEGWANFVSAVTGHTNNSAEYSADWVEVNFIDETKNRQWNGSSWGMLRGEEKYPCITVLNPACVGYYASGVAQWSYNVPTLVTPHHYRIYVRAWDNHGNCPSGGTSDSNCRCVDIRNDPEDPYYREYCCMDGNMTDFIFDNVYPTVGINIPNFSDTVTELTGWANDVGELDSVWVAIINRTDGKHWNGGSWQDGYTVVYSEATGAPTWRYSIVESVLEPGKLYTIHARSRDKAGHLSARITVRSAGLPYEVASAKGKARSDHPLVYINTTADTVYRSNIMAGADNRGVLGFIGFASAGSNIILEFPIDVSRYAPERLGVYRYTPTGLERINSYYDDYTGVVSAYTTMSGSYFLTVDDVGEYSDETPPVTEVEISTKYVDGQGLVYTPIDTEFNFRIYDDIPQGLFAAYKVDPSPSLLEAGLSIFTLSEFNIYDLGFALPEGKRTIAYGGFNRASLFETMKTTTVYVDDTAPETRPTVEWPSFANGQITMMEGSLIALQAVDPVVNGAASGAATTYFLIDVSPQQCQWDGNGFDPGAPEGSCQNPIYTESFPLALGFHTVYYRSVDNVGNHEEFNSAAIVVMEEGTLLGGGGLAVSVDANGNIWEVVSVDFFWGVREFGLSRFSPEGVFISSVSLPGASDEGGWSILFDGTDYTYAAGSIERPDTDGTDTAVFKVDSIQNVLVASAAFASGPGKNTFALDAAGNVWITGNTEEAGGGHPELALWKYDADRNLIELTASYSRGGGFDAGVGIDIDTSGNIWIAGFSADGDEGAANLDLALWKYDPAGTSLLAGPLLSPGYSRLSEENNGEDDNDFMAASIAISTGGVFVSAGRLNAAGNNDLAFLRYDFNGNVIFEKAWHSEAAPEGGSESPSRMALDGGGNLIIAGAVENSIGEKLLAVWKYTDKGGFVSAETIPEVAAAEDIAVSGPDIWLAVANTTVPFKFTGGIPIAGAEGIQPDVWPPRTEPGFVSERVYFGADGVYIPSDALVHLKAVDDYAAEDDGLGEVAGTYYSMDEQPFNPYLESIAFTGEGSHSLRFYSVDTWGHVESTMTMTVFVDATPPEPAQLVISTPSWDPGTGAPVIIGPDTKLSFVVNDPVSSGMSSGGRDVMLSMEGFGYASVTGTFTITGADRHVMLAYYSRDNVLNSSGISITTVAFDATAPVSMLTINGVTSGWQGAELELFPGNRIGFFKNDPAVNGIFSGAEIVYSINYGPFAQYSDTFSLPMGTSSLRYYAVDRVGNMEPLKSVLINIVEGHGGGLAVAVDGGGSIWEIVAISIPEGDEEIGLSKFNPDGVFVSSVSLPSAVDADDWSILFDGSDYTYAIGNVEKPAPEDVDTALFKANSAGNVLVASAAFASGTGKNTFALDATGNVWIVGVIESIEPNGEGGFHELALWKYDSGRNLIELTTSYSRGSGNVGFGIDIDGSENIWIAGFSASESVSDAVSLDLALWKYDPEGTELLAGPFLRHGYSILSEENNGEDDNGFMGAGITISTEGIFVTAGRLNAVGNNDLAFLKYDFDGNIIFEKAWHSYSGGNESPTGIALDGNGNIVISGWTESPGGEDQLAIWKYASDGTFISAETVWGVGEANDIAIGDSAIWLSIWDIPAPFQFTGGIPIPGEEGLEGGDQIPPRTVMVISEPKREFEDNIYVSSTAIFSFTAVDDLTETGDGIGMGVDFTEYRIDTDTWTVFTATFTLAGGVYTIYYRSQDVNENLEETKCQVVYVDTAAPVINISSPKRDEIFAAMISSIPITFSVTDNFDISPSSLARLVEIENKGLLRGPTVLTVHDGDFVDPLSIDDGIWVLEVEAMDWLSNSTISLSGAFEVIHDIQPPMTTVDIGGPKFSTAPVFLTKDTPIRLLSEDDLIEPGDKIGLGVKKQTVEIKLAGQVTREIIFESTEPAQGVIFSSTFTLSEEADGLYTLEYHAEDVIGNPEKVKIATVAVDNTPPVTRILVGTVSFETGGSFISILPVIINFSAEDPVPNSVASGIGETRYRIGVGAFETFVSSFTLGEGRHELEYYSLDNVENAETAGKFTVIVDLTPPAAVTDLRVGDPIISSLLLTWTSPGDDGMEGDIIGGKYWIKYSTAGPIINETDWESAPYELEWGTESIAGTHQSKLITGLTCNVIYWFAIKTADEMHNWSDISNSAFTILPGTIAVSGQISGDIIWPYPFTVIVVDDLTINQDVKLTIEPGVMVKFENGKSLIIDGTLDARGTEERKILFTSNASTPAAGDWGKILFRDISSDEECIIENTKIEYASTGIELNQSSPKIRKNLISYNITGIYAHSDADQILTNPISEGNKICNNTGDGIKVDKVIFVVSDSVITENAGNGIRIYLAGRILWQYAQIINSTIAYNDGNGVDADLMCWTNIDNNRIEFNEGSGIMIRTLYNGEINITNNIISDNKGTGIYYRIPPRKKNPFFIWNIFNNTIIRNKDSGLVASGKGWATVHYNNIYDNEPYDFTAQGWFNQDTMYNWWGTIDTEEIDEHICDYKDDPHYPEVIYNPILLFPYPSFISESEDEIVSISYQEAALLGEPTAAYVVEVSTTEPEAAIAISYAPEVGLDVVSKLYDIGPEGVVFSPSARIKFYYTEPESVIEGFVLEDDLNVYEWNGEEWVTLPVLARNTNENWIVVEIPSVSSIYAVLAPLPDVQPPRTDLAVLAPKHEVEDRIYVSSVTAFAFAAVDDLTEVGDDMGLGVDFTEYRIDAGTWTVFTATFTLTGGVHTIYYRSQDVKGNLEETKSRVVYVDTAAPGINISSPREDEIFAAVVSSIPVRFSVTDNFDPAPYSLARLVEIEDKGLLRGPTVLTVHDGDFVDPLSMDDGIWVLEVEAVDWLFNSTISLSGVFEVIHDIQPPMTTVDIGGPKFSTAPVFITKDTPIRLLSEDDLIETGDRIGLGVKNQTVRIKLAGQTTREIVIESTEPAQGIVFSSTFTLSEETDGLYVLEYHAKDVVDNTEPVKTSTVALDNTAPVSMVEFAGDKYISPSGGMVFLSTSAVTALLSTDPAVNGVFSGLERIVYDVNAYPAAQYVEPFSLTEGINTVNYHANDNVGNMEAVKSTVAYVDGTAPVTASSLIGPFFNAQPGESTGGPLFVASNTLVALDSQDPAVQWPASGVSETRWSEDGQPFVSYSLPFTATGEGKSVISYYAKDNVRNVEAVKSVEVWVDSTPPVTSISYLGAHYIPDGSSSPIPDNAAVFITAQTEIALEALDPVSSGTASGVLITKYRLDSGAWRIYSGSFSITMQGLHTLDYHSIDRVINQESMHTILVAVDNTPPVSSISIGTPKFEAFGLTIIMPHTPITLSAADLPVNGVASGLSRISYRVDNGPVTAYLEPFAISEQGTHVISYWSGDRTDNTEAVRTMTLAVTTFQKDALTAAESISVSGTADIAGNVKAKGDISLGGNSTILGDAAARSVRLTGKAEVTGQVTQGASPVAPMPIDLAPIAARLEANNDNELIPEEFMQDGKLVVSEQADFTLPAGTYLLKGLEITGGAELTLAGPVEILLQGSMTITGGSSINSSGTASNLNIFVSSRTIIKAAGGARLVAMVYAPFATLKLAGNALLGGHYFICTAAISGTSNVIQSGERVPILVASSKGKGKSKTAAIGSGFRTLQIAGPDATFRLGEVYVFPNPARAGAKPMLHIETGVADRVNIKIYTVSGRFAHETTLTRMPQIIDDGQGSQYAYEYAWSGHIPSGVYYYIIKAEKAGQGTLKKVGKFAVVR